jgi:sigma-B regulation protein RsbU (phosphoserine phosphatase)
MQKGYGAYWRRLGRIEQTFLILIVVYAVLFFSHVAPTLQSVIGLAAFFIGLLILFRLARRGMRKAIWRLRNRLIAAYLFIAVVPIALIFALVLFGGWVVISQMAVYLVNTELNHREQALLRPAVALARVPAGDPERALDRFAMMTRNSFPKFEVLVTGTRELRYPADAQITPPPPQWKTGHGLILRKDGNEDRLYAWAHVAGDRDRVTVMAPITQELLANLVPGFGDISFTPFNPAGASRRVILSGVGSRHDGHIPDSKSLLDLPIRGYYPVKVPTWESPDRQVDLILVVNTRISTVLSTVLQVSWWADTALWAMGVVAVIFFIVELLSLIAGVGLSRSITGAVHELYEGTLHVKEGDFSYRIPVKGNDQLAELTTSFNTMTQNLGRLIMVAKEKERLESELAIAREVQNQLFPKDVPFTKTLELRGVCHPARMVSGDYYDFISLSENELAFAIGDVAGKGISAALLMATIQSTMRTQLSSTNGHGPSQLSTAKMVANLNKQLYATTAPEKYATFYFAMYHEADHSLSYTNAGHLAPILLRGNSVQCLGSTGTVVGAFPFARFEEKTIPLEHGDTLVAYTDGIVEPENAYGEMFGEERLKDLLLKYAKSDCSEIIARTMEAVQEWTGPASELQDDMTMVVARRV